MGRATEQLTSTVAQVAHGKRCSRDGFMTLEPAVDSPRRPRRCVGLEEALHAALSKTDKPGARQGGARKAMAVAPPPGLELITPPPGLEPIAPPPGLELIAPCKFSRQSTESTAAPSDREESSSPERSSARDSSGDGGVFCGPTAAVIWQVPSGPSQDRLAKLQPERRSARRGAAPAPEAQARFCHSCGKARIAAAHAFCAFCGQKFD